MNLKLVHDKVEESLRQAEEKLEIKIPRPVVRFDLTGCSAGTARWRKNLPPLLRFNKKLFLANQEKFLAEVVPHEVAHVVQRFQDHKRGVRSKPHGREWKKIMIEVYGLPPSVTHKFDTSNVRRNTKPYQYGCVQCSQIYHFGKQRHDKITKNPKIYYCHRCGGGLERSVAPKKGLTETFL